MRCGVVRCGVGSAVSGRWWGMVVAASNDVPACNVVGSDEKKAPHLGIVRNGRAANHRCKRLQIPL